MKGTRPNQPGRQPAVNKHKRVSVTILGGSSLVLVVVSALWWRDFAVGYHLRRLHASPEYIDGIIASSEGTPAYEAVARYVRTTHGQRRLQKALYACQKALYACLLQPPLGLEGAVPWPDSTATISFSKRRFSAEGRVATGNGRVEYRVDVDDVHDKHPLRPFLPWLRFFGNIQPGEMRFRQVPEFVFDVSFDPDRENLLCACRKSR